MTESWQGPSRKPKSAAANDRGAGDAPPPAERKPIDGEGCPVTPLGHFGDHHWFFSPSGAERKMHYRQLYKREGLESLFEGRLQWLYANFREGEERALNVMRAGRWLLVQCVKAGLFDDGVQRRGVGVWRTGADLIVHCGNRIWIGGDWYDAGFADSGFLYPLAPAIPPPADPPATARDAARLHRAAGLWNFEDEFGPDAIIGFIGLALLGGAPDWRPHLFVRAPYGSGKTWLAEFVAFCSGARPPGNNITPAAIYQGLTGEARALVIDEAEKSDRDDRIAEVIKIIRLMSGRAGANIGRGSADGKAQRFTVTGAAFLTAILHPDLMPQDRSRFLVLQLRPLPTGAAAIGGQEKALAALALAERMAPALQARALAGWSRFIETVAIYRAAALCEDAEPRSADSLAALLAGRDLLLRDDIPGQSEAEGEVARLGHLLLRESDRAIDGEGEQCLIHLLSSHVETWGGGERKTIGEKIVEAQRPGAHRNEINDILGRCGLRLKFAMVEGQAKLQMLLVARRHNGLDRIYQGTRWGGAVWTQALGDLPGAAPHGPTRFAGAPQQRPMAVPPAFLPGPEGENDMDNAGPPPVSPEDLGTPE